MGTQRKFKGRRDFTPAQKMAAVRLVETSRRPITQVAEELGISHKTLWKWVNAARLAKIDPEGELTRAQRERIRDLEKENARLRRDLEFEKKAKAFFRELDQHDNGSL
ncbi:transposase [Salinibacterium sp. ZJ454]|uniref:transposase n=1 Tax=Salinibacterium sp. ZJ454 TaxID=2708339 RepID=UPI00142366B8|nr:transposase [Salinibacterium sp. ZJ454]